LRTLLVAGVGGVVEEVGVAVAAAAAVGELGRLLAGAAVAAVLHQARWYVTGSSRRHLLVQVAGIARRTATSCGTYSV